MAFGHAPRFEFIANEHEVTNLNHVCRRCRSGKYSFIHRRQKKSQLEVVALSKNGCIRPLGKTHREATTNTGCRKAATSVSRPKNRPENRSQACILSGSVEPTNCPLQSRTFLWWRSALTEFHNDPVESGKTGQ